MFSDKKFRSLMPFLVPLIAAFFTSKSNLFQSFGNRLEMMKGNENITYLLSIGFVFTSVACAIPAIVLLKAYLKNKHKPEVWMKELYWQLSGVFFCWTAISLMSLLGVFVIYMWITCMLWLYSGLFIFYAANTLVSARKMLYYPETSEELLRKEAAYKQLMTQINTVSGEIKERLNELVNPPKE